MRWMLNAKFFVKFLSFAWLVGWLERAMKIPHAYKMDATVVWFAVYFCLCSFLKIANALHHFAHAIKYIYVCVFFSMYLCLCHGWWKERDERRKNKNENSLARMWNIIRVSLWPRELFRPVQAKCWTKKKYFFCAHKNTVCLYAASGVGYLYFSFWFYSRLSLFLSLLLCA